MTRPTLFREVNERIRDVSIEFGAASGTYELLCECGRPDCTARVEVPVEVYEDVRQRPEVSLVAAAHAEAGAPAASYRVVTAAAAA